MNGLTELDKVDRAIMCALGANDEWCYPYRYLERMTGLERVELKKHIKRLRQLGYVEYVRGLMDEEGAVAGSGFCVNREKFKEIQDALFDTPENHRVKLSDMVNDFKHGYVTLGQVMSQADKYAAEVKSAKLQAQLQILRGFRRRDFARDDFYESAVIDRIAQLQSQSKRNASE